MSAASARHFQTRDSERGVRQARPGGSGQQRDQARARARAERRRRERHFARRRRDLLEDAGAAVGITLILLMLTAGLGVVALLEFPMAVALLASILVPRARRRRQKATSNGRPARPR